ncbi:MAG: FIST C-terminal domain-containing protein [Desulfovibrio sp.]|nr:FIST C-terminal domain-containing protein [Desulfovibrio sp.]
MKSAVATTFELDNPLDAARQLAASIRGKLVLEKHSLGLLFCDADLDGASVTAALKDLLEMEVAGMTTLAALDPDGRQTTAAVLLVLTADDCRFFPAASAPLPGGGHEEKIAEAYRQSAPPDAAPGRNPGLMFAFCPCGMSFSGDSYTSALATVYGTPLIGGVASDDYDFERARVFLSGREYKDSLVSVGIWGQVRPVFSLRHVTSRFAERIRRVTKAEGNTVYTVGEETFVRYLEGFGLKVDVPDPLLAFTSYPMMLTREEGDETPLMRHISGLDFSQGSGSFLGDVPVGALANICLISKDDITAACRDSLQALLEKAERQNGFAYSTILCISCCGRAMILGADSGAEGRILSGMLPAHLTLAGAYCLGELCPTLHREEKVLNRFHNCSIAFCMF